ncbi:MAG: sigma-70 family RNA polymerase sigma factor [Vicinamibacterales bacterium]
MKAGTPTPAVSVSEALVRRLAERAGIARWKLPVEQFGAALVRSAARRYEGESPAPADVARYVESLHLEDLGLACACARGSEAAWEYFMWAFRPVLLSAARSVAPPDVAIELAESIYADLFGLEERDGERRSLFDYFHGRSSLAGWLRAVLAQRVVDRARAARRLEQLSDEQPDTPGTCAPAPDPDPDRHRLRAVVFRALVSAISSLLPRDRLRLALYYTDQLTLTACGRVLRESEATVSRKLERTRRELRAAVERTLRDRDGLRDAEIEACFDFGRAAGAFDLKAVLPGVSSPRTAARHGPPPPASAVSANTAPPSVQAAGAASFLRKGGSE